MEKVQVTAKMLKFNVGIGFEPLGRDTTNEDNITTAHWALVFIPL